MKFNNKVAAGRNFEGAKVAPIKPYDELKRAVLTCLLGEDTFYEDGTKVMDRIKALAEIVAPTQVAELAIMARNQMKLRHVPLFLARILAKQRYKGTADLLEQIIQRPDEIAEFLAMYWADGKQPVSKQVKKGLSAAFNKFNEYSFGKYNQDNAIKLRDVLFMVHPKAKNPEQQEIFNKIANKTLVYPDTWEKQLAGGGNKKEVFESLMVKGELGGLAFLRNFKNMIEGKVDESIMRDYFTKANFSKVLPYRFIAASKYAPNFESELEGGMFRALEGMDKLKGDTLLVIDTSSSMSEKLSAKSEMCRIDAANGLAIMARELCEKVEIVTFNNEVASVPNRRGFALRDAIMKDFGGGTFMDKITLFAKNRGKQFNRTIIITDEESSTPFTYTNEFGKLYMINVSVHKHAIGFGDWVRLSGFSEAILTFIQGYEDDERAKSNADSAIAA